jgi:phosphopantetheinyl transferase
VPFSISSNIRVSLNIIVRQLIRYFVKIDYQPILSSFFMPLVYQQNINDKAKMAIWHIEETEDFFLSVPLQREITHPAKRLQHLAGRYLLKELYPDFPYDLIKIADTRKPFLTNEAYHFSISHCGKYAAVLVSPVYRVGIDIELFSKKVELVKDKFLSPVEQQHVLPALTDAYLTVAWSIKEAIYKWYGDGEVNFKEHIHIDSISIKEEKGIAYCQFLKDAQVPLTVEFIFFDNHCLSWISRIPD